MANIVIYARYSSQAQTEQSIEGQLRVCREFAEQQGHSIINEYIDRAFSGTTDNRPAFQQMIEDSKKKQFEYILVYKLDRFSRSNYDNAIYKHKLQQNNVKVISATETISNTPEGMIMERLLEMFAELYSKDLSQKVKRGIRENSIKELYSGGTLITGYKVINQKIHINEENAPAVKIMFEEYLNGTPKQEIINILKKLGYKNNKGKDFTSNSILRSLSNQKYIGKYKDKYVESETFYPAIIDKETFYKAQEKLKHKQRYKKKSKENFILAGKLFCGLCGETMVGTSGTSKTGATHYYYGCTNKIKKHSCNKQNIKKDLLENKVLVKIKQEILNDKTIEQIAEQIEKECLNNKHQSEIKQLQNKINTIDKQLDTLTEQIIQASNPEITKRLNNKANDLSELKQTYIAQTKKLKLTDSIIHTKKDIILYLEQFVTGDIKDTQYKQKLIDCFISAILIFDNYIYIHFNILNNQKTDLETIRQKLIKKSSDINSSGSPA